MYAISRPLCGKPGQPFQWTWLRATRQRIIMLFALPLASALLAGYGMVGKSRNWLHMFCFAFVIAVTVFVILHTEYPHLGFIRVDAFDQVLVDLRNNMK